MVGRLGPRARLAWESLRYSYWFVPALLTAASFVLSFVTVAIDDRFGLDLADQWWLFSGDAEGARATLMAIAGSMVTVAGVAFSITVVALTLASSQYGPRLLRGFMRDVGNQIVLGTFIATFAYSLLVLRTIRGTEDDVFVPYLSVTVALLFALASVGVLIYFLHHAASSMLSNSVIESAGRDLDQAARRTFPVLIGDSSEASEDSRDDGEIPDDLDDASALIVRSSSNGYVQSIDARRLLRSATNRDVVVRLDVRPGHHIVVGEVLAHVWPDIDAGDDVTDAVRQSVIVGRHKTSEQDIEFGIEELVEIAIRALSPGVNDTFTAIRCIDRLAVSLRGIAAASPVSPLRYDHEGDLRVIAYPQSRADLVDAAFNQIRQAGAPHPAVAIRMLEVLAMLLRQITDDGARAALRRQADALVAAARAETYEASDLEELERRYRATLQTAIEHPDGPAGA